MDYPDASPMRPLGTEDEYNEFIIPRYLVGHAKKIRADLKRVLRLYNGKEVVIYQVDKTGERCTECTDAFTGAKVLSNCQVCGGTGYLSKYDDLGIFWGLVQFNARMKEASEIGNQDRVSSGKDQIILIDPPLLNDSDLLKFVEINSIYKIVSMEPQICGMAGEIITQTVQVAHLPLGSREYEDGVLS